VPDSGGARPTRPPSIAVKKFLSSLWWRLPGGAFARNVLVIASGSALGQLLVLAASPVLTRLYTPEQFGVLGVYVASIVLLSGLSTLRYEMAIPIPKDDDTAKHLLQLALGLSLGFTIALGLVLFLAGDTLFKWLKWETLAPYAAFLPLGTFLIASYQSLTYWAIRKGHYRTIAATRLWQGLGNVTTQLMFGLAGAGTFGLLAGDVVGRSAGITQLARNVPGLFQWPNIRALFATARRYKKFPIWSTGSTLINRLGLQLPQLFMAAAFGPREAGWYLLTQRVLGMPINVVGQAVAQVFVNRIAEIRREQPDRAAAFYLNILSRMALIGGLPIFVLGLVLGEAFGWLFGKEWKMAGQMVQILAPMFAVQWTFSPTSQMLVIFERQELQFIWDIFRLSLIILAFTYVQWANMNILEATIAVSIAMTFSYLALGIISYWVARQYQYH